MGCTILNLNQIHETVSPWIKEAGERIRKELLADQNEISVEVKSSPNDLVTSLDFATEKFIVEKLRESFPDHKIVSEEGFGDDVQSMEGSIWFIDPIDGTLNFVKQQENFCIMLAYYEDGKGLLAYIYDVIKDKFYHVMKGKGAFCNGQAFPKLLERHLGEGLVALNSKLISQNFSNPIQEVAQKSLGLRLYGSAGIEAIEVATSRTVAYVAKNLQPWDFAPGFIFISEMGGKISNFKGEDLDMLQPSEVVIANFSAHQEIINIFNKSK